MAKLRYWLFCLRYGKCLTFGQWEFMEHMHKSYEQTIGKALKGLFDGKA